MKRYAIHLVSLLSLALAAAFLVPQRAAADDDDPPGRVARLGYVRGAVSFEPAGTDDWVTAVVNRPLTTGDKIWNDNDSYSELHLGSASVRLGSSTGFSFLNLTDNMAQISLTEGTMNLRVRRLGEDETFEVDTPNLAFTVLRPGSYKINVNEAGDTTVVLVREGQGEVTGGGSAYNLHPHDVGTFVGTDQVDADVEDWDNSADDFDDWCAERDARIDHSTSSRYVSDDVIGYEDLDEYGGWRPTPDYGTVWFPHVTVVGWAPYHYGHWAYIAPWGYTWVDDAPWGFAPFHYGRWVVVGGVWGWVPAPPRPVVVGVAYVRPVYAPALVAWVGGPGFAVGVGGGGGFAAGVSVGWFPLGPREVYAPSYPVSRNYWTNVNVSNTRVETTVVNNYYNTVVVNKTVVNNVTYVNQRVPGAVVATTPAAFTSAQPVARNVVKVDARVVASAPVAVAAPAVAPSRQAVLGSGTVTRVQPKVAFTSRAVVAKTAPPPPPPSFARQQAAIQANGGRPIAVSQIRQLQPTPAAAQAHTQVRIAPQATPQAVTTRGPQPNSNRAATPNSFNNRPANNVPANNAVNNSNNRPANNVPANNVPVNNGNNRPNTNPNASTNANTNANANARTNANSNAGANANTNANSNANVNANQKSFNDRPPASRPVSQQANPQLEQHHAEQLQNLRQQQDEQRQKLEQQQEQQRQQLQQKAAEQEQQKQNQQRQQQLEQQQQKLNQQHQQQLEQMEKQHAAEEQNLKQKQQQEKKQAPPPPPQQQKPAKPSKDEKKPNK